MVQEAACAAAVHAEHAAAFADRAGRNQDVETGLENGNAAAADDCPKASGAGQERMPRMRLQPRRPQTRTTPPTARSLLWNRRALIRGMPAGNRPGVLSEKNVLCPGPTGWIEDPSGRIPPCQPPPRSPRQHHLRRFQAHPGVHCPPREPAERRARDGGGGRHGDRDDGEKAPLDRAEGALTRKVLTGRWAALLKHHWESLSEKALERSLRRIEVL